MKLLFVRSIPHDSTEAIPRAIEATRGMFTEVQILCWDRSGIGLAAHEVLDGVTIARFLNSAPRRSARLLCLLLKYQLWVYRELRRLRPDIVQALDFESVLPSALFCKTNSKTLIYDIRDPLALTAGIPCAVRLAVQLLDYLAIWASAGVVVPHEDRLRYLGPWRHKRRVVVIPNMCPDILDQVAAGEERPPNAPVLTLAFLGHLAATRGGLLLVDLAHRERWVRVLAAGTCRDHALLETLMKTERIQWLGRVPRLEAVRLLWRAAAVALLYDPSVPVNRVAAPNKFYEAMMVGTPVIVCRGTNLAKEVEANMLGFTVNYGDSQELRAALSSLRDPGTLQAFRTRCRSYYLTRCCMTEVLGRYRAFFDDLVNCQD